MSTVTSMADTDFEREVVSAPGTVLVYFWAPWCGPCRLMSPLIEWAASAYNDLKVVKMEVDPNPATVEKFKVQGVPALILFKDGVPIESTEGAIPKQKLADFLNAHLTPAA